MSATVRYGVNSVTHERFAGMSVGDIRDDVAEELNIPANAEARLNGARAEDDAQVRDGETLEFVKTAGEKG
jgi:hypothetical protein